MALSGAAACLFVRDIADLKRFSPHVYGIFGWLAVAFVVLALANLAHVFGIGGLIAAVGNLIFLGAAIFTLVVAFIAGDAVAVRRVGSRSPGRCWKHSRSQRPSACSSLSPKVPTLLYYGLPLSMVAAAVFIALGVADRLREQRLALTEAERRAQIDPLTEVLNRRSIVERLDAACSAPERAACR